MHRICSAVGTFARRESFCFVFMLFKNISSVIKPTFHPSAQRDFVIKNRHSLSPAASPLKSSILSGPKSLCCTQLMNRALRQKESYNFRRKSLVSHVLFGYTWGARSRVSDHLAVLLIQPTTERSVQTVYLLEKHTQKCILVVPEVQGKSPWPQSSTTASQPNPPPEG